LIGIALQAWPASSGGPLASRTDAIIVGYAAGLATTLLNWIFNEHAYRRDRRDRRAPSSGEL
jgi:hypothetical protein